VISRDLNIGRALRARQRGFLLNPFRFGGGGGGGSSDPHFANVSLLLHLDGADESTTIVDNSPSPKTATVVGNAQIDTDQSKFGGASLLLDGSGDFVQFPANAGFDFGAGDFTAELQWRPNNTTSDQIILSYADPATGSGDGVAFLLNYLAGSNGGKIQGAFFTGTTAVSIVTSMALVAGQFNHIAYARAGTTLRVFINGDVGGSVTSSDAMNAPASRLLRIGAYIGASPLFANGWADEVRITKGVARYTAAFTPPTAAFPNS